MKKSGGNTEFKFVEKAEENLEYKPQNESSKVLSLTNYKVLLEYEGTKYRGLQTQKGNGKTIQEEIEKAAAAALSKDVHELNFCGRTDSGVHAIGQVFNIKTTRALTASSFVSAMNYYLSFEDIAIISAEEAPQNFHARYSCKARTYVYKILNRNSPSPLLKNYCWFVPFSLNVLEMKAGGELLKGNNDYSYFRASGCWAKSPFRTIEEINIVEKIGNILEIRITAPSFLYKMVRNIVGALVCLGRGKITIQDIKNMLLGKFTLPPLTAPPHGLYFLKADY